MGENLICQLVSACQIRNGHAPLEREIGDQERYEGFAIAGRQLDRKIRDLKVCLVTSECVCLRTPQVFVAPRAETG